MKPGINRTALLLMAVGLGCGPKVATGEEESGQSDSTSRGGGATTSTSASPPPTTIADEGNEVGEAEVTSSPVPPPDFADLAGDPDCWEWADQGCPLRQPTMMSLVQGTTPLGEFDVLPFAFFSGNIWCVPCVEVVNVDRILFVSDPGLLKDLSPWDAPAEGLELRLSNFEGPPGQEFMGTLIAHRDGESTDTVATFTLTTFPAPPDVAEPYNPDAAFVLEGELTAENGPDWSVHGQFWASYCPQQNQYGICE